MLSATPAFLARPPVPLGTHRPVWDDTPGPRARRLGEALRANLRKRKDQARARQADAR
jgi:hypothetical protein